MSFSNLRYLSFFYSREDIVFFSPFVLGTFTLLPCWACCHLPRVLYCCRCQRSWVRFCFRIKYNFLWSFLEYVYFSWLEQLQIYSFWSDTTLVIKSIKLVRERERGVCFIINISIRFGQNFGCYSSGSSCLCESAMKIWCSCQFLVTVFRIRLLLSPSLTLSGRSQRAITSFSELVAKQRNS